MEKAAVLKVIVLIAGAGALANLGEALIEGAV
jgi:hypothetical protein